MLPCSKETRTGPQKELLQLRYLFVRRECACWVRDLAGLLCCRAAALLHRALPLSLHADPFGNPKPKGSKYHYGIYFEPQNTL